MIKTKDEILNMEAGEEADTLVAENVMGWHVVEERGFKHWVNSSGGFQCGVSDYEHYEDGEDFHILHWHPSQSMLWAWEVVERLEEKGLFLSLDKDRFTTFEAIDKWSASFRPKRKSIADYAIIADTAPLAICRAAVIYALERESL